MENRNVGRFEIEYYNPTSEAALTNGGQMRFEWESTPDRAWLPSESYLLVTFNANQRVNADDSKVALKADAGEFRNFPVERTMTSVEYKLNGTRIANEPTSPETSARDLLAYYGTYGNASVANSLCGARARSAGVLANGTATKFSLAVRVPLMFFQSKTPIYGGRHELLLQWIAPGTKGADMGAAMILATETNQTRAANLEKVYFCAATVKPLEEITLPPTLKLPYLDHQIIVGQDTAANTQSVQQFTVPQTTLAVLIGFSGSNDNHSTAVQGSLKSLQVRFRGKVAPQLAYNDIWSTNTDLSDALRAYAETIANSGDMSYDGEQFWTWEDWQLRPVYVFNTARMTGDSDTQLTLTYTHSHGSSLRANLLCIRTNVLGMKFSNNLLTGLQMVPDAEDIAGF